MRVETCSTVSLGIRAVFPPNRTPGPILTDGGPGRAARKGQFPVKTRHWEPEEGREGCVLNDGRKQKQRQRA